MKYMTKEWYDNMQKGATFLKFTEAAMDNYDSEFQRQFGDNPPEFS